MDIVLMAVITGWFGIFAVGQVYKRAEYFPVLFAPLAAFGLAWVTVIFFDDLVSGLAENSTAWPVWTETNAETGALIVCIFGLFLAIGSWLATLRKRESPPDGVEKSGDGSDLGSALKSPKRWFAIALLGVLALISFVLVYGYDHLISRDIYNANYAIPQLSTVFFLFPVVMGLSFGLLTWTATTIPRLLLAVSLSLVGVILILGTASRTLVVYVLIFYFSAFIVKRKIHLVGHIFFALAVLVALNLSLTLRSQTSHGIGPYLDALAADPSLIFPENVLTPIMNVAFSVPLTGYVYRFGDFSFSDFLVTTSLLDGSASGWSEIASKLRVGAWIPYNALGELASLSIGGLCVFAVIVGFVFGTAYRSAQSSIVRLFSLALYLFAFAFCLQYDLRTVSRVVYLTIGVFIITQIFRSLRRRRQRRRGVGVEDVVKEPVAA